jgi:hypothetical protein
MKSIVHQELLEKTNLLRTDIDNCWYNTREFMIGHPYRSNCWDSELCPKYQLHVVDDEGDDKHATSDVINLRHYPCTSHQVARKPIFKIVKYTVKAINFPFWCIDFY